MNLKKFVIIIVILYIFYEIQCPILRQLRTRIYFNKVKKMSQQKGKKLLVIGDPCCGNWGTWALQKIFPNSEHGDVTIDLFGCNKCDKMDINDLYEWKKYKTNSYVILDCATLSFGKNITRILKEIKRISGGDFFSSGGTTTILWKYFGSKKYSNKYPNSLYHMIYPFNSDTDKFYYYYNLNSKKENKILWNEL